MEIYYNLIKEQQKVFYDILVYYIGQEYDKIKEDCECDNWMIVEEVKEYGLIDEVLDRNNLKKEVQ